MKVEFLDSTLRDGAQGEGISFSVQDKLHIVRTLDDFGVQYIEAGNPGSNPKDMRFFERLRSLTLKRSKLCAFGSTRRNGITAGKDDNVRSLLAADTPAVSVFGKSWNLHVESVLRVSLSDNLNMVRDTLRYLKEAGRELIFDAEHFFDGSAADPDYAMAVLQAALEGGADCLCLCDTNGGALPQEVARHTARVREHFPGVRIGIHCHDDIGCAVANSMAAVDAGATQVQGTFVGFGERCGNANLSILIPNLLLKCGHESDLPVEELVNAATRIAEIANVNIRNNQPYIGKSAFAHKGGMHVDGVMKVSRSFEHVDPQRVGNERRFLLSEVAGRGTLLPRLQRFAPALTKASPETARIMESLKEQENVGYHYEAADASFELFVKRELGLLKPHFQVIFYKISDDFLAVNNHGEINASAIVQIETEGKTEVAGEAGNGPVNALDSALRKALRVFYPRVNEMRLTDFKVRVIDQSSSTAAKVRVLIESTDGQEVWTTIGVSNDVIEASFMALVDSYEYKLSMKE